MAELNNAIFYEHLIKHAVIGNNVYRVEVGINELDYTINGFDQDNGLVLHILHPNLNLTSNFSLDFGIFSYLNTICS